MEIAKRELVERLVSVADRMAAQTRTSAMREWSDVELTMPQLRALGFLAHAPRRMGDLAAFLGSSVSSTTSLVERLEGKGLAERTHDPVDRRVVKCHLTSPGRALMDRFWRMQRLHLESVADALTAAELAQVVEALELLSSALERHAVDLERPSGRERARQPERELVGAVE
jgi:DNA-binding MarR family transcriptional regulator